MEYRIEALQSGSSFHRPFTRLDYPVTVQQEIGDIKPKTPHLTLPFHRPAAQWVTAFMCGVSARASWDKPPPSNLSPDSEPFRAILSLRPALSATAYSRHDATYKRPACLLSRACPRARFLPSTATGSTWLACHNGRGHAVHIPVSLSSAIPGAQ